MSQAVLVTGGCRRHKESIMQCFTRATSININENCFAVISEYDLKVYVSEITFYRHDPSHKENYFVSFLLQF
jgi:hypothetical protein